MPMSLPGPGNKATSSGSLSTVAVTGIFVSGVETYQGAYRQTNIASGGTIVTGDTGTATMSTRIATLQCGTLQALVLDYFLKQVQTGASFNVAVYGIEPQTGSLSATLTDSGWVAGTLIGDKLIMRGPLGSMVGLKYEMYGASNNKTSGIWITAQQSVR